MRSTKVFVSHSSKDEIIVKSFCNAILLSALGLHTEELCCSSMTNTRTGGSEATFRPGLIKRMTEAEAVVVLFSEAFKGSEECCAEIGWTHILGKRIDSVLIDPHIPLPSCLTEAADYSLDKESLMSLLRSYSRRLSKEHDYAKWESGISEFLSCAKDVLSEKGATPKPGFGPGRRLLYSAERRQRALAGEVFVEGSQTRLGCTIRDYNEFRGDWTDKLRTLLTDGAHRPIPTKFLYGLEGGWMAWLNMISEENKQNYAFYWNSISCLNANCSELVKLAIEASSTELDYVSLGCGDGRKDAMILQAMVDKMQSREDILCYMPIEISGALIDKAVETVWSYNNGGMASHLEVLPIHGDICSLPRYKKCYEYWKGRNFFAILGNTIGNSSEGEIIEALRSMLVHDIVLFEVNTNVQGAFDQDAFVRNADENWKRHTLPLRALHGTEPKRKDIRYEPFEGRSILGDQTVSVVATCASVEFYNEYQKRTEARDVVLSTIHHYVLSEFEQKVNKMLGLRKLASYEVEKSGVGYYLAQKAKHPTYTYK